MTACAWPACRTDPNDAVITRARYRHQPEIGWRLSLCHIFGIVPPDFIAIRGRLSG
jgi:hypothetical protein